MILHSFVILCLVATINGQRKYYSLHDMPETNFDCRDKILGGYYADPETNCQMFHVCVKIPGQGVQDFRFLCPNETAFDQENQICADSGDIDCEAAGLYLENFDLYRIGSAPAKRPLFSSSKGTVVPLGPSTKSPILTNNINEDDEFYLQRSDTGDRRLHSKDLLRGSSSSNFFNNRNKGKDLEDDEEEENLPKTNNENTQGQFKKTNNLARGKLQYSSQFRKAETTSTPQQASTSSAVPDVNLNDKKRTKIAVRKLTRKRPQSEEHQAFTKTTVQPNYSTFTTQVTQKFSFGEQESKYNTINRVPTTPSSVSVSANQQRHQSNFRGKTESSSSTLAFFEPSPTPRSFPKAPEVDQEQIKPDVNLQRQPIVAAAPNFQNNRPSTSFQPPHRQPTTTTTANNQSPSQNYQINKQTTPQQPNYQQPQNRLANPGNFQQNRPVSKPSQPQQNNQNFQQPRQNQANNGNFQQRPANPQPLNNGNFQPRPANPQPPTNNGKFQPRPANPQPPTNNGNFQQRSSQSGNNGNFQPRPANSTPNRQTTASTAAVNRAQTINNALQGRPTSSPQNLRNYYNRNFDDFEEGDNQEFLKTAPSNNFRPSDLNSFKNNYKSSENFDNKNNVTKFGQTSTTKYYTPTIITTPKTSPSTFSTNEPSSTLKQVSYYSTQVSTNSPNNYYTPSVSSTNKFFGTPSSTLQPPTSGPQPRPFSSTPNQQPNPSPSAKPVENSKDASYDYAYYDDAGSFSEYDALDALGETDFVRTSQRTKSRLI